MRAGLLPPAPTLRRVPSTAPPFFAAAVVDIEAARPLAAAAVAVDVGGHVVHPRRVSSLGGTTTRAAAALRSSSFAAAKTAALAPSAAPRYPLSTLTLAFLLALAVLALHLALADPRRNLLVLALVAVHPAVLLAAFRRLRLERFVPLDTALRVFAAGFLPAAVLAASWERVAQHAVARLFGHDDVGAATAATSFAGGHRHSLLASCLFFLLVSYGTTSAVEEVLKLGTARSVRAPAVTEAGHAQRRRRARSLASIILAVAGAAGFATVENLVYLAFSPHSWDVEPLLFRIAFPASLHLLCGLLTGARLARRDHRRGTARKGSLLRAATPAILVHGTYDLAVNVLHAAELRYHRHFWLLLWATGLLVLAAGLVATALVLDWLRADLRVAAGDKPPPGGGFSVRTYSVALGVKSRLQIV